MRSGAPACSSLLCTAAVVGGSMAQTLCSKQAKEARTMSNSQLKSALKSSGRRTSIVLPVGELDEAALVCGTGNWRPNM